MTSSPAVVTRQRTRLLLAVGVSTSLVLTACGGGDSGEGGGGSGETAAEERNENLTFATADTGIKSIEDLKGKRVSPGAVGSASEVTADRIMQAAGLDPQADIERVQLGVAETVAAIQDGTVDAGFWSGGLPTGAIVDLASTEDLVLIPTGEYADELAAEYGDYYFALDIPAGTYE